MKKQKKNVLERRLVIRGAGRIRPDDLLQLGTPPRDVLCTDLERLYLVRRNLITEL